VSGGVNWRPRRTPAERLLYRPTVGGEHDERGGGDAITDDEASEPGTAADQRHQSHVGSVVERRRPVATRPKTGVAVDRQRRRELVDERHDRWTSHRRPRRVVRHLYAPRPVPRPSGYVKMFKN